jgi:hypothetical protein
LAAFPPLGSLIVKTIIEALKNEKKETAKGKKKTYPSSLNGPSDIP